MESSLGFRTQQISMIFRQSRRNPENFKAPRTKLDAKLSRAVRSRQLGVAGKISASNGGEIVRTLLIDNYDSYTFNIFQELSVVNGAPPTVIRNDEWTWEECSYWLFEEQAFDNIIISPGPGSPMCPGDVGICLDILRNCRKIPILGVCLGHQALGFVHGARILHAPEPVHGRLSEIEHTGIHLFNDIPSGQGSDFKVVRYHSLVIDPASLPKDLVPIAWTVSPYTLPFLETEKSNLVASVLRQGKFPLLADGSFPTLAKDQERRLSSAFNCMEKNSVIMGVMHSTRPHYGVQFHPESVATRYGRKIFENFKRITANSGHIPSMLWERKQGRISQSSIKAPPDVSGNPILSSGAGVVKNLRLHWKKIDGLLSHVGGAETIFCELFGDENARDTFWLDSASTDQGRARFSFMGGKGGSLWKQITFQLCDQTSDRKPTKAGGYLTIQNVNGSEKRMYLKDGFFHFLEKELHSYCYDKEDYKELPFDFCGGFVGYIGYDLKVECGASSNKHKSTAPDTCFFFSDNLIAIDHSNGDVYILSLHEVTHSTGRVNGGRRKNSWLVVTEGRLLRLKSMTSRNFSKHNVGKEYSTHSKEGFVIEKSRERYTNDVKRCLKLIKDGESYELCMTTQMRKRVQDVDPLRLYLTLRNQNPAPYAALLNFAREGLCICSSSPERFLQLDRDGKLEAKPIKGTISRGRTLEEDEHLKLQLQYSEKDQAENLMIVDLLRNDLGRVCLPGTVNVPHLMQVESYATVHTLVSTIQGKRNTDFSPVACVRAAFPGGSMTGAPKLRSMELLDSLETSSRGVYSGSIGFFSYNQTFDLNIVIRTVVIHNGEASVGAGGAIVALSNPDDEYEEMLLKAKAPTEVVEQCAKESTYSKDHPSKLVEKVY